MDADPIDGHYNILSLESARPHEVGLPAFRWNQHSVLRGNWHREGTDLFNAQGKKLLSLGIPGRFVALRTGLVFLPKTKSEQVIVLFIALLDLQIIIVCLRGPPGQLKELSFGPKSGARVNLRRPVGQLFGFSLLPMLKVIFDQPGCLRGS